MHCYNQFKKISTPDPGDDRMRYIRYQSIGNSAGLENDIDDYWELGPEGYIDRSINIQKDGTLLKYDRTHVADSLGALPEGIVTEENLYDASYGKITHLSFEEFENKWVQKARNRD